MRSPSSLTLLAWFALTAALVAQDTPRVEFDVVSIKPVTELSQRRGFRTLPDGSQIISSVSISGFVREAAPVKVREVIGLPGWAETELFDVTVKPPAGATEGQRRVMWRAMFADRMKFAAHMEERERTVYALVVARSDRRLGPELKPSTLDCTVRPQKPREPGVPFRFEDFKSKCGYAMNGGSSISMVSGGMSMDQLAMTLEGAVDAQVENRTRLEGWYALALNYAPLVPGAQSDVPDVFTAVQEQLGLKLEREKKMMPVFVIDQIERPSEN